MDPMEWLRALFALAATLALIGLAALGARRLGMLQATPNARQRRMRVVERLALDPRRSVVILRVDDAEHVILLSAFGDNQLSTGPAPPPVPAEPEPNELSELSQP
jgi:flagellar protein FliO/FliZ